jgi:hypothetical protein
MTAIPTHRAGNRMSDRAKSNMAFVSAIVTLFITVAGLIWAMSARANDLIHISQSQTDHEARIRNVESFRDSANAKLDDIRETLRRIENRAGNH